MKVKTKFGVLVASMALFSGALVGCGSDPTPVPPPPSSYHVVCTKDDAKYTVNGLADTYAAGASVAFTITENDPTNYKVTGVTSTQVSVTTVSALSYSFTMPETDVSLTVGTKEVDKYSVTASTEDIVVNEPVTFLLKLGETEVVNITISKGASETKSLEIDENEVTFKEEGEFTLAFKDNDRNKVAGEFTFSVRERVHGETEDDPLTAAEAIALGHELDITWNEKVDGKTVWHYGGVSEYKYYIEDVVTFVKDQTQEDLEKYKNRTFNFGEFQAYQIQWKSKDGWEVIKDIQVGTTVKIYTKLMNFGGQNTEKAKGTVETYKLAPEYPAIVKVDNETLQSITLDSEELRMVAGEDATLTATLVPNTGADISWRSDNEAVATVEAGVVHAVANGETTIYAEAGEKSAECKVIVSDTKQVYRMLSASELSETETYVLAAKDDDGMAYAKDEVAATYYVATTRTASEASDVKVIKSEGKFKLKLGDSYLGYEWNDGHHNILREADASSTKIVEFTFDETFRFHFAGGDDAHTELYLNFYSGNMSYTKTTNTNPQFAIWAFAEPVAVTSVTLSKSELALHPNDTATLTFATSPLNSSYETATFASDNTDTATVDPATGVVTAVAAGKAEIKVTVDGVASPACVVTVTDPGETSSVEITAAEMNITSAASPGAKVEYTESGLTVTLSAAWKGTFDSVVHARCGKNSTISFAGLTITKIEFVCTGDASGKDYGPKNFGASSGEISVGGDSKQRTGTWTGEDSALVLTCKEQVRFISMTITFVPSN